MDAIVEVLGLFRDQIMNLLHIHMKNFFTISLNYLKTGTVGNPNWPEISSISLTEEDEYFVLI